LSLIISVPAAVGLIMLNFQVIQVFLQHNTFGLEDTLRTGRVLGFYALGLPFYFLVHICTRGFYALQDTRTPVRVALLTIPLNLALNLILVRYLAEAGISLATTLSAVFNLLGLGLLLRKRVDLRFSECWPSFYRCILATGVMGSLCFVMIDLAPQHWTGYGGALLLAGAVLGCAGIYLLIIRLLGVTEIDELLRLGHDRKKSISS